MTTSPLLLRRAALCLFTFLMLVGSAAAQTPSAEAAETLSVCGSMPPAGWIATAVRPSCAKIGTTAYIGRTIKKLGGLAPERR
jgi:hypothetical protein